MKWTKSNIGMVVTFVLLAAIIIAGVWMISSQQRSFFNTTLLLDEDMKPFGERGPADEEYPFDSLLRKLKVEIEPVEPWHDLILVEGFVTINGDWSAAPEWTGKYAVPEFTERGGDHNAFCRIQHADGTFIDSSTPAELSWSSGTAERFPEASGWSNIPIFAKYNLDTGRGGYNWGPLTGNKLMYLGLPDGHHVSFFGVWVPRDEAVVQPTPTATYMPTVTPQPTATPESECGGFKIYTEKDGCSICICLGW